MDDLIQRLRELDPLLGHGGSKTVNEAADTIAELQARIAALESKVQQGAEWLREVGDDYPGSSCHKWCHERAAMLTASAAEIKEQTK